MRGKLSLEDTRSCIHELVRVVSPVPLSPICMLRDGQTDRQTDRQIMSCVSPPGCGGRCPRRRARPDALHPAAGESPQHRGTKQTSQLILKGFLKIHNFLHILHQFINWLIMTLNEQHQFVKFDDVAVFEPSAHRGAGGHQ